MTKTIKPGDLVRLSSPTGIVNPATFLVVNVFPSSLTQARLELLTEYGPVFLEEDTNIRIVEVISHV